MQNGCICRCECQHLLSDGFLYVSGIRLRRDFRSTSSLSPVYRVSANLFLGNIWVMLGFGFRIHFGHFGFYLTCFSLLMLSCGKPPLWLSITLRRWGRSTKRPRRRLTSIKARDGHTSQSECQSREIRLYGTPCSSLFSDIILLDSTPVNIEPYISYAFVSA